ncbi:inner centromere protein-like [Antennarius striatus]|uniref:inner centromere protein-like n=1 Tax=Antennarius striatus TaxID=241820 RepID=UPI0035B123C7
MTHKDVNDKLLQEQLRWELTGSSVQLSEGAQLETLSEMFRRAQTSLEEQTSCIAVLQAQLDRIKAVNEGLEKDLQQERASYEAQLEDQQYQMDALEADLDKAEAHLDASWLYWQQENMSLLKHTEELERTLKKTEQESETNQNPWREKKKEKKSETHQGQWRQEKMSLYQEMDALKTTLKQKEQEWENKEKALTSQLEELQDKIQKKKSGKKWYRRLFSRCPIWDQEQRIIWI